MSLRIWFRSYVRDTFGTTIEASPIEARLLRKYPWLVQLIPLMCPIPDGGIEFKDFDDGFLIERNDGDIFLVDDEGHLLSSAESSRTSRTRCVFNQIENALDKLAFEEKRVRHIVWRGQDSLGNYRFKICRVGRTTTASQQIHELYSKTMRQVRDATHGQHAEVGA